jgi:DNA-binding CsgD family transcriptional regulator/PAS domain-containing protein
MEARRLMTTVMTAVVEPSLWPQAMDSIGEFFGGVLPMAEFHSTDRKKIVIGPAGSGFDPKRIESYLEHYAETCPRPNRLIKRGVAAVQTEVMIGTEADFDRHPYYVDFLAPEGLRYHVALRLGRRGEMVDVLAIQRRAADGDASEEEIAWMYELAPFLRAAFAARALLGDVSLSNQGLVGSLARLDSALVFLSADGRVLFENEAAQKLLRYEPQPDWPGLLLQWQRAAATAEDNIAPPLSSPGGRWLARLTDLRGAVDPRMAGGVYVVALEPTAAPPPGSASRGLTAAEATVLSCLLAGLSPHEIAVRQGVSMPTVRTHIAHLHEKFGVHRTIDVVRVALAEGFH